MFLNLQCEAAEEHGQQLTSVCTLACLFPHPTYFAARPPLGNFEVRPATNTNSSSVPN
jgi:hypothetical protein